MSNEKIGEGGFLCFIRGITGNSDTMGDAYVGRTKGG